MKIEKPPGIVFDAERPSEIGDVTGPAVLRTWQIRYDEQIQLGTPGYIAIKTYARARFDQLGEGWGMPEPIAVPVPD